MILTLILEKIQRKNLIATRILANATNGFIAG
jgi:hypothetical protein